MHYSAPQRIDLYKDSAYVPPTNAYFQNNQQLVSDPRSSLGVYMPHYSNTSGTNLFYKPDQKVYFSMDGACVVELKIAPVLFVSFGVPLITPEEFFSSDSLVANLALLLDVSPSMIRRVNVVREASRRRRRLAGEGLLSRVEITLEENAPGSINDQAALDALKEQYRMLAASITNVFATGQVRSKAEQINQSVIFLNLFQLR